MNIIEDDGRSSSSDSFSHIENQNKADDVDNHESGKLVNDHQNKEESAKSTMKELPIVEVAQVSYNDYVIRIFTDIHSLEKNGRCFYFEPVVFLDLSSIVSESNDLLKQDLVRFKIKMWDAAIRAKVLNRLRSVPSLKSVEIQEEDVRVMPYEEVQLKVEPNSLFSSIKLKSKPICYSRLRESLNFQFECASSAVAVELADNFKRNPELFLEQWELTLECRGLTLGAKSVVMTSSKRIEKPHPTWIFNVSSLPCGTGENDSITQESLLDTLSPRFEDLQDQIKAISSKKSATCVPVFSVGDCTNPSVSSGQSFGFSTFVIEAKAEHGEFDLSSGIYTVKTAGNYLLNFNGLVFLGSANRTHQFDLKVNDVSVATSFNDSDALGFQPAVICTLLPLKAGDKVGIFAHKGELHQEDDDSITRFFGILLLDPSMNE